MRRDDSIGRISDRNRHNDEITARDAEIASLRALNAEMLAVCVEFLPILQRQLDTLNPGGAAAASVAFQYATARVDRMRVVIAKVRHQKSSPPCVNDIVRQDAEERARLKEALGKISARYPCATADDMSRVAAEAIGDRAALACCPQGERSET